MKRISYLFLLLFIIIGCTKKEEITPPDTITPIDSILILVNKQNPIKELPTDLVEIPAPAYRTILAQPEVSEAYLKFINEAPYDYWLYSGYRTIEYQEKLYLDSGKNNNLVAKPYESEHHTGLALDISTSNSGIADDLSNTEEGKYMFENIHKYGFILRYPKGKEKITGYQYEPWHYRYVGLEHAKNIYEKGLTLEEYLETFKA